MIDEDIPLKWKSCHKFLFIFIKKQDLKLGSATKMVFICFLVYFEDVFNLVSNVYIFFTVCY